MLRSITTSAPYRGLDKMPFINAGQSCVLGKKTVIYGRNGAGKTSLSELLRMLGEFGTAEEVSATASVRADASNRSIAFTAPDFPFDIYVYNRFYVADSLGVFLEGDGTSAPILKLGKANVLVAQELELTRRALARTSSWRRQVETERARLVGVKTSVELETKNEIIATLNIGDPAKYTTQSFTVAHARKHLELAILKELDADSLKSELSNACASNTRIIDFSNELPKVANDIRPVVNALLAREVESKTIPELVFDKPFGQWVEDGLALHTAGTTCRFCKVGIISDDVFSQYRRHFSSALAELRSDLQTKTTELESLVENLTFYVTQIPAADGLLVDFQPEYSTIKTSFVREIETLVSEMRDAIEMLRGRLADPLVPVDSATIPMSPLEIVNASKLTEVLARHDKSCSSQGIRKSDAQSSVEIHIASKASEKYKDATRRIAIADRAIPKLKARENKLSQTESTLNQSQQDTGLMATLIDQDLRDHFGHDHLSVSVSGDGKGYIILRNGTVARTLSEGERNSIAFCYFLRSLGAEGVKPERTLVVVDDPVTSLDKEALFAAFSLAEERTDLFAQTIFLTHDYEYFRLQLTQRSNAGKKSSKRISDGDAAETSYPAVSVLEMFASDGAAGRVSRLRPLSPKLLDHPSEYHYLFSKIGVAVVDGADDELPLLGNAARRLIEGFIGFRAPQGQDFQAKIDAITSDRSIDRTLSRRIVKFLHGHSHRDNPSPTTALDFPSVESELKFVLQYMKLADEAHFTNMCKAVGIDHAAMTGILEPTR